MTVIARRFTIRWNPTACRGLGGYLVSVPNYDGGEVVAAEHYDALADQLKGAVARCECGFAGTNVTPDALCGCCGKLVDEQSMRWLVENALANFKRGQ